MIVLIDGKEVKVGNDIKIIIDVNNEDQDELHLTITHEGVITDIVDSKGDVAITDSNLYEDLVERLLDLSFIGE